MTTTSRLDHITPSPTPVPSSPPLPVPTPDVVPVQDPVSPEQPEPVREPPDEAPPISARHGRLLASGEGGIW